MILPVGTLSRPEIKICGITTPAMALACAEAGADAIGILFVKASRRYVESGIAREIVAALPAKIPAVGVFMNASVKEVLHACSTTGIAVAQLHGEESPRDLETLVAEGIGVVKRLKVAGKVLPREALRFAAARGVLVECGAAPLGGGGGAAWDWGGAAPLSHASIPFAISGGLTPENVAAALAASGADAVDVSSGVETAPGIKSPSRVKAFVESVVSAGSRPRRFRRVFSSEVSES